MYLLEHNLGLSCDSRLGNRCAGVGSIPPMPSWRRVRCGVERTWTLHHIGHTLHGERMSEINRLVYWCFSSITESWRGPETPSEIAAPNEVFRDNRAARCVEPRGWVGAVATPPWAPRRRRPCRSGEHSAQGSPKSTIALSIEIIFRCDLSDASQCLEVVAPWGSMPCDLVPAAPVRAQDTRGVNATRRAAEVP